MKKKGIIIACILLLVGLVGLGYNYYSYSKVIENKYTTEFGVEKYKIINTYLNKKLILLKNNDVDGVNTLNKTLSDEETKLLPVFLTFDEKIVETESSAHPILFYLYQKIHK